MSVCLSVRAPPHLVASCCMWLLAGVSRHYTENNFTDASQRTTPQTWPWNTILWYSGLQLLGVRPQDFLVDRVSIDLCVGCLLHALHSHPSSIHLYHCGCHGGGLFSQAGKCHLMPSRSCLSEFPSSTCSFLCVQSMFLHSSSLHLRSPGTAELE